MTIPPWLWLSIGASVVGTVIAWAIVAVNKREDEDDGRDS